MGKLPFVISIMLISTNMFIRHAICQGIAKNKTLADMTESERASALERAWPQIQYLVDNLGHSINQLDKEKSGDIVQFTMYPSSILTPSMIAEKYGLEYPDHYKVSIYFHKNWQLTKECYSRKKILSKQDACVVAGYYEGPGDSGALAELMGTLYDNLRYEEWLKYWPEYYNFAWQYRAKGFKTVEEFVKKHGESIQEDYARDIEQFATAKRLAGKVEPKPIEPFVLMHEYFYSKDRAKVLESLAYYHKYKVRFMLEKALRNPNKEVAAQAAKLLKELK